MDNLEFRATDGTIDTESSKVESAATGKLAAMIGSTHKHVVGHFAYALYNAALYSVGGFLAKNCGARTDIFLMIAVLGTLAVTGSLYLMTRGPLRKGHEAIDLGPKAWLACALVMGVGFVGALLGAARLMPAPLPKVVLEVADLNPIAKPLQGFAEEELEFFERAGGMTFRIAVFPVDQAADVIRPAAFASRIDSSDVWNLSLSRRLSSPKVDRGVGGYVAMTGNAVIDMNLQVPSELKPYAYKVAPGQTPDGAMICLPIYRSGPQGPRLVAIYCVSSVKAGPWDQALIERVYLGAIRLSKSSAGIRVPTEI